MPKELATRSVSAVISLSTTTDGPLFPASGTPTTRGRTRRRSEAQGERKKPVIRLTDFRPLLSIAGQCSGDGHYRIVAYKPCLYWSLGHGKTECTPRYTPNRSTLALIVEMAIGGELAPKTPQKTVGYGVVSDGAFEKTLCGGKILRVRERAVSSVSKVRTLRRPYPLPLAKNCTFYSSGGWRSVYGRGFLLFALGRLGFVWLLGYV